MRLSFDTCQLKSVQVARQWRRIYLENWTSPNSFLELLCFLLQCLWRLHLFWWDAIPSWVGIHLSAIRRKPSRFGWETVEIAQNPHQQGKAIENRLQKGPDSTMLLTILISVNPPPWASASCLTTPRLRFKFQRGKPFLLIRTDVVSAWN